MYAGAGERFLWISLVNKEYLAIARPLLPIKIFEFLEISLFGAPHLEMY
jgi:hypothetical protein